MGKCRHILAAIAMTLVVAGAVHADLMPVSNVEAGIEGGVCVSAPSEAYETTSPEPLLALSGVDELACGPIHLLAELGSGEAVETTSVRVLADRSNSFDLCLYALIGLGVFRSGQWVRIPSLGFIPEWYHSGGPDQVGHSHAIGPDAFCHAAICFIQPGRATEDLVSRYGSGTIISLCRKSQFTPNALASRGPPSI